MANTAVVPFPSPARRVELPLEKRPADLRYTREEAAAYLDVEPQTLAVWASTKRYDLPFIKVGRNVRYRKSALDAFLERRTVGAPGV